jgi:hypothetical protein
MYDIHGKDMHKIPPTCLVLPGKMWGYRTIRIPAFLAVWREQGFTTKFHRQCVALWQPRAYGREGLSEKYIMD